MKTFAHTNASGDILGVGMIYFEDGSFTPEVAALVAEHGLDAGIVAYGDRVRPSLGGIPDPAVSTIVVDTEAMPGGAGLSYDKTFRGAFKRGPGDRIDVDLPGAKEIAHEMRREKRAAEFAPLDIRATIPAEAGQAEAAREAIRQKYAEMQIDIDAAETPEDLKTILGGVW